MQKAPPSNHFVWLDWLRFLAAFVVLLCHVRAAFLVPYGDLPPEQHTIVVAVAFGLTRLGDVAVIAFFVLSGFLVGGKGAERIGTGTFRSLDYSIDRISRLMVPLVPTLLLSAFIGCLVHKDVSAWHFVGNLFALQGVMVPNFAGNYPLWSLAYEVWFYLLLWAIGTGAAKKSFHIPSALALVLVCAVFTKLSPTYLFCWIVGALAYLRQPKAWSMSGTLCSLSLCVYGVIAVQLASDSVSINVEAYRILIPTREVGVLCFAVGMALFVQQIIRCVPDSQLAQKVERVGTILAAFSYTLYLTHYPILYAIEYYAFGRASRIDAGALGRLLMATVICLVAATMLYWVFEKRTPNVRRWLKTMLQSRSVPAERTGATVVVES